MANWLSRLLQPTGGPEPIPEARSYEPLEWAILVNAGVKSYKIGVKEETALAVSAVFAAVDRISSSLASIPLNIYEQRGDTRIKAVDYDQYYLLHTAPNIKYNSFQFRKTLFSHALLWGNGYVRIHRDQNARPKYYEIILPSHVTDIKDVDDRLYYHIQGVAEPIPYYDMIHITGMSLDGYMGKSPVRIHAESLGAALARNQYSASVMENGGFMSGIIKSAGQLKPEQKEGLRNSFMDRHTGAKNAGSIAVLEYGLEYQQLGMSPKDVQLIEAMKFTVEDVARIYGIPQHMIGNLDRSTNNNIEHQGIEYVQYCLMPWAVAFETAVDSRIHRIFDRGRYYTKLELNALLRGDINSRKEFYKDMLDRGVFSINDVLGLEDMNPVAGGDTRMVMANMMPLDKVNDFYQAKIDKDASA